MMFFSIPTDPGPRQRSAFDRSSKEVELALRSEGAVDSTADEGESSGGGVEGRC